MYRVMQEEAERNFRKWIGEQNYKIEVLSEYGFDRDQAIEMLKLLSLVAISEK